MPLTRQTKKKRRYKLVTSENKEKIALQMSLKLKG